MNKQRIYSLDFLKIVAAFLILFHHYQQVTGATFETINFYQGKFEFNCVVQLFFVLSGFVMFDYSEKIIAGLDFRSFFLKRAIRLLPLVAVAAVAYEFFLALYHATSNACNFELFENSLSLWGTVITALGIQAGWVFTNPQINNPSWYVSVLLLCYIVFYLSCYVSKKLSVPATYIHLFIALSGIGIITYGINLPFLNITSARGYYAFFWGILLAKFMKGRHIDIKLILLSICTIFIIPFLLIKHNHIVNLDIYYIMTFVYYPALIILFHSEAVQKLFSFKIIGVMGQISYSVYIWHLPLLLLSYSVIAIFDLSIDLTKLSSMLGFAAVASAVGVLSHFFLERPIHAFLAKKVNI